MNFEKLQVMRTVCSADLAPKGGPKPKKTIFAAARHGKTKDDIEAHQKAVELMRQKRETSKRLLAQLVKEKKKPRKIQVLGQLGEFSEQHEVFSALMKAIKDPDPDVRLAAISAAVKSRHETAWAKLFIMYHCDHALMADGTRKKALAMLLNGCSSSATIVYSDVKSLFRSDDSKVREVAYNFYARVHGQESRQIIIDALARETDPRLRDIAKHLI